MNKYQEALSEVIRTSAQSDEPFPTEEVEALQELVDRATPKKPVQKPAGRKICPNCKRSTAREVSPLYCCVCGQRLDWSEE